MTDNHRAHTVAKRKCPLPARRRQASWFASSTRRSRREALQPVAPAQQRSARSASSVTPQPNSPNVKSWPRKTPGPALLLLIGSTSTSAVLRFVNSAAPQPTPPARQRRRSPRRSASPRRGRLAGCTGPTAPHRLRRSAAPQVAPSLDSATVRSAEEWSAGLRPWSLPERKRALPAQRHRAA